jgi:hypothetical protein
MPYFREPLNLSDNLDYARDDMRTTYLNAAEDFKTAAEYLTPTVDDTTGSILHLWRLWQCMQE